jgi:hypothetical protein
MAGNAIVRKEKKLSAATATQSHYLEILQVAIFMDQNMRYVLILGRLATLNKKNWADYEQVFSCFHEQIKCLFFLKSC